MYVFQGTDFRGARTVTLAKFGNKKHIAEFNPQSIRVVFQRQKDHWCTTTSAPVTTLYDDRLISRPRAHEAENTLGLTSHLENAFNDC
jgi:hypothetical protein